MTPTRAPRSSSSPGRASTAPCSTSCAARTGRRARCAAGSVTSPARASSSTPSTAAGPTEAKGKFRRAFELLPKREREVAVLLYVKNLTLREIGEILGVSESRVCQIHSQLKRTLKQQLADDSVLFSAVG